MDPKRNAELGLDDTAEIEPLKLKIRRVRTRLAAGVRTGLAVGVECNPYCHTSGVSNSCSRTVGVAPDDGVAD